MASGYTSVAVELVKLTDYCLSESHPRGRHKARVFRARFGLTSVDAEQLRSALLAAVKDHEADLRKTEADEYGQRHLLDFEMTTAAGTGIVRSTWIVRAGEDVLRLTSCYVL
jgi:hypothetical protein